MCGIILLLDDQGILNSLLSSYLASVEVLMLLYLAVLGILIFLIPNNQRQ